MPRDEASSHVGHSTSLPDLRLFPMQDGPPIPWFVAQAIYDNLYRYGGQTLERVAERGGFGWDEVSAMSKDHRRTSNSFRVAARVAVRTDLATLAAALGHQDPS